MNKAYIFGLFYKGKHSKNKQDSSLTAMLFPSVLGIIVCAVLLMGSTWAWFAASQNTALQTLKSAKYDISPRVISGSAEITEENGAYTLEAGEYTVTLAAGGDATTGYCILDFNGSEQHTVQIPKDTEITFELSTSDEVSLKITPQWGTSAKADGEKIENGDKYTYSKEK